MFVWSFRMSKREIIIFAAGLALFAAAAFLLLSGDSCGGLRVSAPGYTLNASNRREREAFLRQFGWTVEPDPVSVCELTIPAKFDEVYEGYNRLQLSQGFDLSRLRGETVKQWRYRVTNYPGCGNVYASLLVKDGRVVGGDISSTELSGFMHGFDPNAQEARETMAAVSAMLPDRSVPASIPPQTDAPEEPADLKGLG